MRKPICRCPDGAPYNTGDGAPYLMMVLLDAELAFAQ